MTDHPTPAAVLAERIAERIGWSVRERMYIDDVFCSALIVGDNHWETGVNQMMVYPLSIHIYAPGESCKNFGLHIDFHTPPVQAHPSWRDRHRWTDEGREFVRRIDNACDGMISYGLTNASETACLDWLHHDPE